MSQRGHRISASRKWVTLGYSDSERALLVGASFTEHWLEGARGDGSSITDSRYLQPMGGRVLTCLNSALWVRLAPRQSKCLEVPEWRRCSGLPPCPQQSSAGGSPLLPPPTSPSCQQHTLGKYLPERPLCSDRGWRLVPLGQILLDCGYSLPRVPKSLVSALALLWSLRGCGSHC